MTLKYKRYKIGFALTHRGPTASYEPCPKEKRFCFIVIQT